MSSEIEKVKDEIDRLAKELNEFDASNKFLKYPSPLKYKCPYCGAKPNKNCVTNNGQQTSEHYDRRRLISKESASINKVNDQISKTKHNLMSAIDFEKSKLYKMEAAKKKDEEKEKFLESIGDISDKSEMSLLWSKYEIKVTRVRNISGLMPDDVIPDRSVVDMLIERGVDVIVEKETKERPMSWNVSPYSPFGFVRC